VVSGNPVAAVLGLATSLGAAAATAVIVAVLHSPRPHPAAPPHHMEDPAVPAPDPQADGDPAVTAAAWLDRLGAASLSPGAIASAFGWAQVNWAADVLCLAARDRRHRRWRPGAEAGAGPERQVRRGQPQPHPYGLGIVNIALITALHGAGLTALDVDGRRTARQVVASSDTRRHFRTLRTVGS
jgi:hypothetical protein